MSTTTEYWITSVWYKKHHKNESIFISDVWLHKFNTTTNKITFKGDKKSKDEVATMYNEYAIYTATWNYKTSKWTKGALIEILHVDGEKYLRSHKDASITDNLDNMLNMDFFPKP